MQHFYVQVEDEYRDIYTDRVSAITPIDALEKIWASGLPSARIQRAKIYESPDFGPARAVATLISDRSDAFTRAIDRAVILRRDLDGCVIVEGDH